MRIMASLHWIHATVPGVARAFRIFQMFPRALREVIGVIAITDLGDGLRIHHHSAQARSFARVKARIDRFRIGRGILSGHGAISDDLWLPAATN